MAKTPAFPWMKALKGDPLPWLLQKDNPCVRYRTLRDVLDRPDDDPDVVETKPLIWKYAPVKRLIGALDAPADPPSERSPWKFRIRDLDVLYRFGVPRDRPAIAEACGRLLDLDPRPRPTCYGPQVAAGIVRFADPADPRLKKWVRYIAQSDYLADGNRPGVLRHGSRGSCCGSHSCFSAVARSLWAAAGVPDELRTRDVLRFIKRGRDYLAAHRVYKSNHRDFEPVRREWLSLHLPFGLDGRTDVLDLLNVATLIGLNDDPSVVDALRFVMGKQNARGRWPLEQRFKNDRDLLAARIWDKETVGKPSKWVTLMAVTQLKRCAGLVERICTGETFDLPAGPPRLKRFADYPFRHEAADRKRVTAEWERFGMAPLLQSLLAFAETNGLSTGWHWGFVMGPRTCPEWCSAMVRWVPRKGDKQSWPVARVYFLARRGQFTPERLAERLKIPVEDEDEKKRFNKFFWKSLWRIRIAPWRDAYDEVAVTLREPKEFTRLKAPMRQALAAIRQMAR